MRIYYVYMHNTTDSQDDEVYKVKANDEAHAKEVADSKQNWPGRFSIGWVRPATSSDPKNREFLKSYKWWATDRTG